MLNFCVLKYTMFPQPVVIYPKDCICILYW